MPSIVWCDRARYYVRTEPGETVDLIEEVKLEADHLFVFLDRVRPFFEESAAGNVGAKRWDEQPQVALKISAISAVEKAEE